MNLTCDHRSCNRNLRNWKFQLEKIVGGFNGTRTHGLLVQRCSVLPTELWKPICWELTNLSSSSFFRARICNCLSYFYHQQHNTVQRHYNWFINILVLRPFQLQKEQGAYHLVRKSGNFGLKSNGKVACEQALHLGLTRDLFWARFVWVSREIWREPQEDWGGGEVRTACRHD